MKNYVMARRRRGSGRKLLAAVVIVAAVGVGVWRFWPGHTRPVAPNGGQTETMDTIPTAPENGGGQVVNNTVKAPASASATGPAGPREWWQADPSITLAQAQDAHERGIQLLKDARYLQARGKLSEALRSGRLGADDGDDVRKALELLADVMIFSSRVYKDDPLVFTHQFQPGQVLAGRRGLIRQMGLRVPHQIILKINRVAEAEHIQAGKGYKLIRGPFHAVIHKSRFVMDVYLQDTFVKRYRVCIGAPKTPTPKGYFRVAWSGVGGGKTAASVYYPPAGRGLPTSGIAPGQPGYPLGKKGYNIKLHGISEKGTDIDTADGYAIHGTSDSSSIGKMVSLGCVRLAEKDIEEVYFMLYERWSTVTISP